MASLNILTLLLDIWEYSSILSCSLGMQFFTRQAEYLQKTLVCILESRNLMISRILGAVWNGQARPRTVV